MDKKKGPPPLPIFLNWIFEKNLSNQNERYDVEKNIFNFFLLLATKTTNVAFLQELLPK